MSNEPDPRVSTIPLDTDDGDRVVIEQENAGPGNQVGGGEFTNDRGRTVDEAADEQEALDAEAPVDEPARRARTLRAERLVRLTRPLTKPLARPLAWRLAR